MWYAFAERYLSESGRCFAAVASSAITGKRARWRAVTARMGSFDFMFRLLMSLHRFRPGYSNQ
jgi:hypothetical protein